MHNSVFAQMAMRVTAEKASRLTFAGCLSSAKQLANIRNGDITLRSYRIGGRNRQHKNLSIESVVHSSTASRHQTRCATPSLPATSNLKSCIQTKFVICFCGCFFFCIRERGII